MRLNWCIIVLFVCKQKNGSSDHLLIEFIEIEKCIFLHFHTKTMLIYVCVCVLPSHIDIPAFIEDHGKENLLWGPESRVVEIRDPRLFQKD